MDQEQSVLYEPLGEVAEVVRNVIKAGNTKTFTIIFHTARPAPRCGVKQAHKVQDQCKSKCCFSLPSLPSLCVLLQSPFTTMPRGSVSPPLLCSSEDNIMLLILWNGTLLWDVGKQSNTNWHLILQAPHRCQLCGKRGGSRVCCVGGSGGQGEGRGCFLTGSEVQWRRENRSQKEKNGF